MTASTPQDNAIEGIPARVKKLHQYFSQGITKSYDYRQQQLLGLLKFIHEREDDIINALRTDLGKSAAEALSAEIGMLVSEINFTLKHLSSWMKAKRVATPMAAQPATSLIYPEPLGVILVIAPWNYPVQLTLTPMIGAIAAGNCVMVKPSELAPASSRLLAEALPAYVDKRSVQIVQGGIPETTALLAEAFDHIIYTGNGKVAQIVMTAAAKHLTPVTLELGGKSPCIIDELSDLKTVAKRLIWAKFSNAGQTCIAPDYVLVNTKQEQALLSEMKTVLLEFYGRHPITSADYGRIINKNHFQRLMKLIPGSGDIVVGGEGDEQARFIEPTILRNVPPDSPVMADEIFGPILPVLTVNNIDEAIAFINARPKPLALYLFSNNKQRQEQVISSTSSGSVSVNFPMMQMVNPQLPFGGVGPSGMGAYHGKFSFDSFTHYKPVMKKPLWLDLSLLYPPYGQAFMKVVRWLMM